MDKENRRLLIPLRCHEPIRCEQAAQAFLEGDLRCPAECLCDVSIVTDPIGVEELSNLSTSEKWNIPKEARKDFIGFP